MWQGVKGLWKFLKHHDRLRSSQADSENEAPAEWSDLEDADNDLDFTYESSSWYGFKDNP